MTEFRLAAGADDMVAEWAFRTTKTHPMLYNAALGVVDGARNLRGAVIFTGFNGSEVEVHYYGPGTLKRNILKEIFIFALKVLGVNRMTVRTRKASMARGVQKLGALYEGRMRRVYGPSDGEEHAAAQYVFLREDMERVAGLGEKKCAVHRRCRLESDQDTSLI